MCGLDFFDSLSFLGGRGGMRPNTVAGVVNDQGSRGQFGECVSENEVDVATGTVKWFNGKKGYGFIQPDDGGKDVFVHITAVERAGMGTLNENQRVSYELAKDRGKTSAVNLKSA